MSVLYCNWSQAEICLFVDLKMAFDTVDPLRFSLKLKRMGPSGAYSSNLIGV